MSNNLSHEIKVGSVPFLKEFPCRLNIKKRREKIVHKSSSTIDNVNIAYATGDQVVPSKNLFIVDRSTSLTQNRIPLEIASTIQTTGTFNSTTESFLITDAFVTESATIQTTPLYYAHTLSNFNDSLANFSNMSLLALEFADYSLKTISLTEYSLNSTTGVIYNNIENYYDSGNGTLSITFVKYTVREISGSTISINIYHELINNRPVFEQASFDDVDEFGVLDPTCKKYLIEAVPDGSSFLITLPATTRYAFKELQESRIKVLAPVAIDLSNPWNTRVTNGSFIASLRQNNYSYINYKYYIAEFNSQYFTPYPPYKLQTEHVATRLSDSLVQVPKNITENDSLGLFTEIIVKDSEDIVKYAYTTDTSKDGTIYAGSILYSLGILSVDGKNGFLELNDTILETDSVIATYYTEEKEYEFTSVDFNPINNIDILEQRVVVYLNPETQYTGALTKSLYYLLVNQTGKILYSSQVAENYAAGPPFDTATTKMLAEDFTTVGIPSHDFYYDITSTASGLASYVPSGINLGYIDEFSFIDKYTVESVLFDLPVASGVNLLNFADNPHYLVLADTTVGESQAADSIVTFDTRTQGGGIKEGYEQLATQQNPLASSFWDAGVPRIYPSVGVVQIEYPQSLLTEHDGTFTKEQIRDIATRHMKIGGYPILKSYGVDPMITAIVVDSGNISITWPSYGSDTTYNVYKSFDINSNFAVDNSTELVDNTAGNTYNFTALIPATKYYVKVEAMDGEEESFGQTVSATTAVA